MVSLYPRRTLGFLFCDLLFSLKELLVGDINFDEFVLVFLYPVISFK